MERVLRSRTSYVAIGLIIAAAVLLVVFHPWRRDPEIPDTGLVSEAYNGSYSSGVYQVSFKYPGEWQMVPGAERYEGESGFVAVSAAGGDLSLDNIISSEAGRVQNPYGTHPETQAFKVDGEAAGLIVPSDDQDLAMKGQAALIVAYPKPIKIGGKEYPYLVLLADEYHIRSIAATLKFK